MKPVFHLLAAADPGRQGGVAVAGNELHGLDGLLAFPVTVRRTCATWAALANPVQAGTNTALIVRRSRRPWPVLTAEVAGIAAQDSFSSCLSRVGMLALTVIT